MPLVVDASAAVEVLLRTETGERAVAEMRGASLHAPAHLDAEVLSALGRLNRAGEIDARDVDDALEDLASAPIERHPLPGMLTGAWRRRDTLRPTDALYVELADALAPAQLLTTDARLARSGARVVLVATD